MADIKFEIEKELGSISELNPVIADYKSLKKAILCIYQSLIQYQNRLLADLVFFPLYRVHSLPWIFLPDSN